MGCFSWLGHMLHRRAPPADANTAAASASGLPQGSIALQPMPAHTRPGRSGSAPRRPLSELPGTWDIAAQAGAAPGATGTSRNSPVDFEKQALPPVRGLVNHADHGGLRVARAAKEPGSTRVRFDLALVGVDGQRSSTIHSVYVINSDDRHGGRSTLGFGDIDFPSEMQGKGIGSVYLDAVAQTARDLGVDLVVVQNVVTPAMDAVCTKLGMRTVGRSDYALDPATLHENALARGKQKGWGVILGRSASATE